MSQVLMMTAMMKRQGSLKEKGIILNKRVETTLILWLTLCTENVFIIFVCSAYLIVPKLEIEIITILFNVSILSTIFLSFELSSDYNEYNRVGIRKIGSAISEFCT